MQYHIQTDPIWEAFKSGCDCPLCEIYAASEARLVGQYLDEAVMAPEFRVEVNKYGFCREHIRKLFAGKNKLGLALQLHTRMLSVRSVISPCKSYKQAVKQADELEKTADTCVICRTVDEMMLRYAHNSSNVYQRRRIPQRFFQKQRILYSALHSAFARKQQSGRINSKISYRTDIFAKPLARPHGKRSRTIY